MTARGRTTGTVAVPEGLWTTVCTIKIRGADGVHIVLQNTGAGAGGSENITAVRLMISYTDLIGDIVDYPYATQNDVEVLLDRLWGNVGGVGGACDMLAPLPKDGTVYLQMETGAVGDDTDITYEFDPVDQARLGKGIVIDGLDYGSDDTPYNTPGQIDVDDTLSQAVVIPPECQSALFVNCSIYLVYIKLGADFTVLTNDAIPMGACTDVGGAPVVGTGGAVKITKFKGTAYLWCPAGAAPPTADVKFSLEGVQ